MAKSFTPTRYGRKKGMSPAGIATVVILHGAAITAVVMSKSYIINPSQTPTQVELIEVDDPPPPTMPEQPVDPELPDVPVTVTSDPIPLQEVRPRIEPPITFDPGPLTRLDPPPPPPPPPPRDPVVRPAQFANNAALQPPYPPRLIRQNVEGNVTVRVRIGADGRVTEVQRVSADHELFFEATREHALRRWRFTPETRNGHPVASWQTHTVQFRIS